MIAQKSLREANVLVGKFSQIRRLGAIVLAGFEQVWAVERAVQRHLALASAAEVQISPLTAGQCRRGRRVLQSCSA